MEAKASWSASRSEGSGNRRRHPLRTLGKVGARAGLLGALALVVLIADPAGVVAQEARPEWKAPRWVGDVTFTSSNALLGGLTAGVMQTLRGGDFKDGFARGALGGATAYLGRRVAAQGFSGAGLLGRQVSAVGTSVVRNAGEGRPSLERLVFPIAPVRIHVDRSNGLTVQPKVGLKDLAWILTFTMRPETDFDWSASLSAGAPVFRSPLRSFLDRDGVDVDGVQASGVIGLSDVPDDVVRGAFAHERVHVLQHDFAFLIWSDPIEGYLMERSPVTSGLYRYVELGVVFPALRTGLYRLFEVEHGHQPGEIEAKFLDRRPR